METKEKQIEDDNIVVVAAKKLSESYVGRNKKDNELILIAGAFMPETKEYWQRGMYSEEEVKTLIQKFNKQQCASTWFDDDEDWFNTNKKK